MTEHIADNKKGTHFTMSPNSYENGLFNDLYDHLESLFVLELQLLNVDGLLKGCALFDRRLLKSLPVPQFTRGACLVEFALEFLKCPFDVFSIFNRYDNHNSSFTSFRFTPAKIN